MNETGLTEVQSSQQFANDENVRTPDQVGAQRRAVSYRGITNRGTQVGEGTQLTPKLQQSTFWTKVAGKIIKGGATDRAQQDCLRRQTRLQSVWRQRILAGEQCGAADVFAGEMELMAEGLGHSFQDASRPFCDLWSDPVTGEDGELEEHGAPIVDSDA